MVKEATQEATKIIADTKKIFTGKDIGDAIKGL